MKNLNPKAFLWLLLIISGIFWFGLAFLRGLNLDDMYDFFKVLPHVVTLDLIIATIFFKWVWKWSIFKNWLVPFPDLNGTWEGYIKTTWINPETSETPPEIPAILTIKQTFLNISCVLRTAEMTSNGYSSGFKLDSENQSKQLSYSYTSRPSTMVTDRSPIHDGTILFDIVGDPAKKLKGQYWTTRKTTGEVIMTFREKARLDEYPEDLGAHPMKQQST